MTLVWECSQHKGSELLVLLALADFADDEGVCWPSIPTLSKKSRLGQRQTYYIISDLLASGELMMISTGGGRRSNKYQVNLSALTGAPGDTPADIAPPAPEYRAPLNDSTPEPSIEPSVLPQTYSDTPYLRKSVAPDEQVITANVFVDQLVQEVHGTLPAMTQSRKARYGREFKQQIDGGANRDTLMEAVSRIAERWPDYQLSVEQAIRDNQNLRAKRREDNPHPQGDRKGYKMSEEEYERRWNERMAELDREEQQ